MEKVIKYGILIIFIIILFIGILLFVFKKENSSIQEKVEELNIKSNEFEIVYDNNIFEVDVNDVFFNVERCAQYYIDYINQENHIAIYTLLDKNYIQNNNITIEKLKNNISKLDTNKFIASKINCKEENESESIYYVYGKIVNEQYTEEIENNFTVIINYEKNVFSIIPESLENNNIVKYNSDIKIDEENQYNEFIYETYTEDKIILKYFYLYKELAINKPEEAFELLDQEYRNKRFNDSEEKFIEYLNEVNIKNSFINKYTFDVFNDYKEYVGIDENGRYYIFKETAPMKFSIKLDTYTIESNKFIFEYDNGNDNKKIMMSINKWVSMIQNKDYENAYNLLDGTFKNNNFNSVYDFKNYIIQEFINFDSVEYNEQKYLGEGIYLQNIKLKNDEEYITKNIIIKLKENRQFIVSFDI